MNIVWGLPTQTRTVKKEKFETPVLTMHGVVEKGANRKFTFNSAAKELLGLIPGDSLIVFGFDGPQVFIMSTGVVEKDEEGKIVSEIPAGNFVINKGLGFSDKKYYNYIASEHSLDTSVDNYLHLETIEGQPFVKVTSITNDGATVNKTITTEVVEKEATLEVTEIAVEEAEQEPEVFEANAVEATQEDVWEVEETVKPAPVVEEAPKFKIKPTIKTPEVKATPDASRVKFAVDNTEDEVAPKANDVAPWEDSAADEDEEW